MAPEMTPAETQVMQVLVDQGEATTKDVYEALAGTTDWAHATVVTFIRRLEAKGLVSHRRKPGERAFYYRPTRSGKSAGLRQIRDLVDRVFGGNPVPLVSSLLEEKPLTPEQLDALRALLNKQETQRRKRK